MALLPLASSSGEGHSEGLLKAVGRKAEFLERRGFLSSLADHFLERARRAEAQRQREEAKRFALLAKGALLDLVLPEWAKELRYFRPHIRGEMEEFDHLRGVVFYRGWPLETAWPGQWFRGYCRPKREAPRVISEFHKKGPGIGTYMSGGMMPINFALLPGSEDDWSSFFMLKYAGSYWHHGGRW